MGAVMGSHLPLGFDQEGPEGGGQTMRTFFYVLLRATAIALGLGCTVWSAYQSWEHNPWDFTGPLAATAAAALFIYCEHAAKDRQWVHFGTLGVLGLLAAVISGSVVLHRRADTEAQRQASAQSKSLPRLAADKALVAAEAELQKSFGRGSS